MISAICKMFNNMSLRLSLSLSLRFQRQTLSTLIRLMPRTRCPVSVTGVSLAPGSCRPVAAYRTKQHSGLLRLSRGLFSGSCSRYIGCDLNRRVESASRNQCISLSAPNARILANKDIASSSAASPRRFNSSDSPATNEGIERISTSPLPNSAAVVVCGGGVVGCSVGFHLAQRGCNVVLLEQGRLGS